MTEPFDIVITGGQVIDPANDVVGRADVGIRDGRIAAVGPDLPTTGVERVIDATGQIVTPGLIDLHTHIYWGATYWGIEADPVAARTGVTTWLDVGSAGGYSFPGFREYIADRTQVRVYALLNLSSIGLIAPSWELANPDYWDVELAAEVVNRNRDIILGIKARIDGKTTRGHGIEPLRRARQLADQVGLPLMTHIGAGPPAIEEVLDLLRPGDILTHCCTGNDMKLIDDDHHVLADVRRLHDAGVILDVGHGTGSFSFETAEAMLAEGIKPDVISSDIHQMAVQGPAYDLPTTLAKFLTLGMSVEEVIACATINAANAIGLDGLGTLSVGSVADVAVFRLDQGEHYYYDISMIERAGEVKLVNTLTMIEGVVMERLPERETHFWATVPEQQRDLPAAGEKVIR